MSVAELKEMDFILNEAIEGEGSFKLVSSDESEGEYSEAEQSFDEEFISDLFENENSRGHLVIEV